MMKVFVVLAACVAIALAHGDVIFAHEGDSDISLKEYHEQTADMERIIGGSAAIAGQFPWMVAVRTTRLTSTGFCGGALISNIWVLTAAFCVISWTSVSLQVGGVTLASSETGRVNRTAAQVIIHPNFSPHMVRYDIALIRMNSAVTFTNRIQAIRLPYRGETAESDLVLRVSGWGSTNDQSTSVSQQLMWVDLTTITNAECSVVYGAGTVLDHVICAVGNPHHSTCNGDAGGPLIRIQNGVATHVGVACFVHRAGCASEHPSGYIRTEPFLPWIASETGLDV